MKRRIFLGIPVPTSVKHAINTGLVPLIQMYPHIRWVQHDNYHITVSFIGEVEESVMHGLIPTIGKVLATFQPFAMQCNEIIKAPHKKPRMLWASCGENEYFNALVTKVENAISLQIKLPNYRKDHSPHPHITLARFDGSKVQIDSLPQLEVSFEVNEIYLFESILSQSGPKYATVQVYPLPND